MDNNESINKNKKTLGILPCVILSTLLLVYISAFTVFPFIDFLVIDFLGIIALGLFCGCQGLILKRGSLLHCLIAPIVAIVAFAFSVITGGNIGSLAFAQIFNIVFPVLFSVIVNVCSLKKTSGGSLFVLLAFAVCVYILCHILLIIYDSYNSISLLTIQTAINDASKYIGNMFSLQMSGEMGNQLISDKYNELAVELGRMMEIPLSFHFHLL